MPSFLRSLLPLALLLFAAGCGDPQAKQPDPQTNIPNSRLRQAGKISENAETALETLPGYWRGEVRLVLDDNTQQTEFAFAQRVTDLGQVYQYLLGPFPAAPDDERLAYEHSVLTWNGGAIADPNHWVFREEGVLVFDELPAQASRQAWESFQEGEEYDIAPDCWMRRKYLVQEIDDNRMLLMQPRRMAGWLGEEYYEDEGVKGVVVELTRLTEAEFQDLRTQEHDPHYD